MGAGLPANGVFGSPASRLLQEKQLTTNLHRVMHGVAIKKHAGPDVIASVTGLPVDAVRAVLLSAEASGRVVGVDGKYLLSPAGRMILDGEYSRFYDELRSDADFVGAYEQFERINIDLKQLITDWQVMGVGGKKVTNDHADGDYDTKIIGRLGDLHERFEPLLERMMQREARLSNYKNKLHSALEKAEDGETAWVSDATLESYHTVWFEMHEDLLRLLGREREE